MNVGTWIRRRRQELGLSQADLAERLGWSQPRVSHWERNQVAPGEDAVQELERILGPRPAAAAPTIARRTVPQAPAPTFAERDRLFSEAVSRAASATARTRGNKAYGVSNSAKVIEGGIQLAVLNLDRFDADADGYILMGVLRFAPADEVLFALHVRSGIQAMFNRLEEMKRLGETAADGGDETLRYAARNNNVVAYLAGDGSLYLRNKGFWDALPDDLSQAGTAIPIESVYTATWSRHGMLGNGAREFVRYLADLASNRWTALFPWHSGAPVTRELEVAVQTSSVLAVSGNGAVEKTVRHALAVHGFVDPADDPWLVVDPAEGIPQSIATAVAAATDSPDAQVWLVQRVHGEQGRRWMEGLNFASRYGLPLSLGRDGSIVMLPRNLVVVCGWESEPPPPVPVPTVTFTA